MPTAAATAELSRCNARLLSYRGADIDALCEAPHPSACQGTDWPPMTALQRYAEDRRLGQRVPPSVSTWRPEDVRRQQEADALARAQATVQSTVAPVAPGPACEERDR